MQALRIRTGWNTLLLAALVVGALAVALVAGSRQYSASQSTAADSSSASGYTDAAPAAGPNAQDASLLLDTFDRATAFMRGEAPEPADNEPLLDTFDRATALMHANAPAPGEELTDLSDRHTPEDLLRIMASPTK